MVDKKKITIRELNREYLYWIEVTGRSDLLWQAQVFSLDQKKDAFNHEDEVDGSQVGLRSGKECDFRHNHLISGAFRHSCLRPPHHWRGILDWAVIGIDFFWLGSPLGFLAPNWPSLKASKAEFRCLSALNSNRNSIRNRPRIEIEENRWWLRLTPSDALFFSVFLQQSIVLERKA